MVSLFGIQTLTNALKRFFFISEGKKVLVGIYYTEVEDWFFEWYNGGLRWEGYIAFTSLLIIETFITQILRMSAILFYKPISIYYNQCFFIYVLLNPHTHHFHNLKAS